MKSRIMYIERKAEDLEGDARIGRVIYSKSGRTIYYRGKSYRPIRGYKANYVEIESGEEYWISGCKKGGGDRLYGQGVPIEIDEDVRDEYWTSIRGLPSRKGQATAR